MEQWILLVDTAGESHYVNPASVVRIVSVPLVEGAVDSDGRMAVIYFSDCSEVEVPVTLSEIAGNDKTPSMEPGQVVANRIAIQCQQYVMSREQAIIGGFMTALPQALARFLASRSNPLAALPNLRVR